MIRTPAQIKLMALGLPDTPCNIGGSSESKSSSQNTTNTQTTTTYQDRRNVADGGSTVVSADQSSVFINNQTSDAGAIAAGVTLGSKAIDASTVLTQAGASMLDHNIALTRDLASGSNSLANQLFSGAQTLAGQSLAQSNAALQVVQSLGSLPLKLNDPNRAILLVGMAVVGVAAVMMMRGKV